MILFTGLTIAAVAMLLVAEWSGSAYRRAAKTAASTGFIAVAIVSGALDSAYGRVMLVGFALAWIGDLLLTFTSRRAFLGGLVSFLLGHMAYLAAFGIRGVCWWYLAGAGVAVLVLGFLVWRWVRPHLDRTMTAPVAAYVVVISAMVVGAVGTAGVDLDLRIVVGACAFFLSDLFVARQRFVAPGFVNRGWGLPLYYGAQILLALSID